MKNKTTRLVFAAVFAALCAVTTVILPIPSPTKGYINPGDCIVLLSGWLIGSFFGATSAGFGAAVADIITGNVLFSPASFIIKGAMSAICYLIIKRKNTFLRRLLGAVTAEGIMIAAYFAYSAAILGTGYAAAANIPSDIIQGIFGTVTSVAVYAALEKTGAIKRFIQKSKG